MLFSTFYIPDTMLGKGDIDSGVSHGWWVTKERGKKTKRSDEEDMLDKQRTVLTEGLHVQRHGSMK